MKGLVSEHDTRLWRLLQHYVKEAREQADYSDVKQVGVDETSSKRGHNYVSLFVDLEKSKTIFVTEDKDSTTVELFKADFPSMAAILTRLTMSLVTSSPAFIKGIEENFPQR